MPQLDSITIEAMHDEDPPLDHLGRYATEPGPEERTVDREARGDRRGRNEVRYFVAARDDHVEEAYERREQFASGELFSYGIKAEATVTVGDTTQTITSAGVWGIASDADEAFVDEIARGEIAELRGILGELGIDATDEPEAEWSPRAPWSGPVAVPA